MQSISRYDRLQLTAEIFPEWSNPCKLYIPAYQFGNTMAADDFGFAFAFRVCMILLFPGISDSFHL